MRLICGIDLGQANDHSALCAVERLALPTPIYRRKYRYVIRVLDELPLGVAYPDQVKRFVSVLSRPGVKGSRCGVDYTGVGRPVYDLLKDARPPALLYPILTTGGHAITFDEATREFHVPKSEQVGLLQVLLQADLLNWHPALAAAGRLADQLARYRVKLTGAKNETFAAEAGSNDDLVSAVMTACWLGEHTGVGDVTGIGLPAASEVNVVASAPAGVFATGNGV
jgi:hypothetical protein